MTDAGHHHCRTSNPKDSASKTRTGSPSVKPLPPVPPSQALSSQHSGMGPAEDQQHRSDSLPYQRHFHHSPYNTPALPPLHNESAQQERSPRTSSSVLRRASQRSGTTDRSYSDTTTSTRRNSPPDHQPLSPVEDEESYGGFSWAYPEPSERPQRHSHNDDKTTSATRPNPPLVGLPVSPSPWHTSFPREQQRPDVGRSQSVPQPSIQQSDATERRKSRGLSSKVKSAWGGLFKKEEPSESRKIEARHWTDEDY